VVRCSNIPDRNLAIERAREQQAGEPCPSEGFDIVAVPTDQGGGG
jgi:hypothetical protein